MTDVVATSNRRVQMVLVGYSSWILSQLDAAAPAASVLILEEREIIGTRSVRAAIANHPCVIDVAELPIHDEVNASAGVLGLDRPPGLRAVLGAVDYGVVWAAALADAWAVPGSGSEAARCFRDKARLRETAGRAGIEQPDWRRVESLQEVMDFAADHRPGIVIKPSNLQGSVGVRLVDDMRDLGAAWAETLAAAEPRYRASSATQPSYLVESRMRGREVSVETFVKSGTVGFGNVTEKIVLDGEFPVEMGHVVPARRLTDETVALLHSSVRQLVGATGFQTGVLHSEWMIDGSGVPGLVECAARIPGDGIDRLISLAYDFDFVAAWIGMLLGGPLPAPRRECAGAAVEYFQAPASPKGAQLATEELLRFDGVASGAVAAYEKSDRGIRDSSDRNGYVICRGGDADAAFLAARQASAHAQAVLSRS